MGDLFSLCANLKKKKLIFEEEKIWKMLYPGTMESLIKDRERLWQPVGLLKTQKEVYQT